MPTGYELQQELLKKAQESANTGDAKQMFIELSQSTLLEGLARQFSNRYKNLNINDIQDIIADAVTNIYERVLAGNKIASVGSYLWKIVNNEASKRSTLEYDVEGTEATARIGKVDQGTDYQKMRAEDDQLREELIRKAESLIPRLGLVNVQNVMKYVFVAIRNGAEDVPAKEIAEALSLKPGNVRQCLKRGFDRLAQIFKDEQLVPQGYEFPFAAETEYYFESENGDD
jgi:RNA polymerase sigma factor (sigma-70 family)